MPIDPQDQFKREERLSKNVAIDRMIDYPEAVEQIQEDKKADYIVGSGFPTIDRIVEGFWGGELIIISGPTKHGKTKFCQTITRNLSKSKIYSTWFEYEIPKRQFIMNFNCFSEPISLTIPNRIVDKKLSWLDDRILEAKLKFNSRVVFIDHLHFLLEMERMRNASLEIGSLILKLKTLAMGYNLVMFLVSHLTKVKLEEEPTENDLRDSSFISQNADATFMIWRIRNPHSRQFERDATLCIRNHRRTGQMERKVRLTMVNGYLEEAADEQYGERVDRTDQGIPF